MIADASSSTTGCLAIRAFFTNGTISFDPADPRTLKVDATFETRSVNTHNPDRDKDLRSDLFFDVAKYPKMTFRSRRAELSQFLLMATARRFAESAAQGVTVAVLGSGLDVIYPRINRALSEEIHEQ